MSLPIQLISTDFDGTLHADFETPPVPLDLQRLIAELQSQGAKWIINTGRDLTSVMEGMARARLSIKPDYLVVVEREVYCHENSEYRECLEWNTHCRADQARLFDGLRQDVPRLIEWIHNRFTATLYEDDYSPFCMIADSNEDADTIHAFLEDYARTVPGLAIVRNDVYARFSHKDYNKGTALSEIARLLGIDRKQIFAAGDHLNDLPMLDSSRAACLAAPENAVPAVKNAVERHGGYVSLQPWGHGVARGLEHYLGK